MQRITRPARTIKLHTILLAVNLIVISTPLSGIYFLRIYENELVRQTEAELIAQGAIIAAFYKKEVPPSYGVPVAIAAMDSNEPFSPIPAQLNIKNANLPPRPDGRLVPVKADKTARIIAATLAPVLAEAKRITLTGVRLLDTQGIVIDNSTESGLSLAHVEEVQAALAGKFQSALRKRIVSEPAPLSSISRVSSLRVFVAMPILMDNRLTGVVLLSRSPRSIMKALYEERQGVATIAALLVIAVILISVLTSYAINRPIRRLLGKIQRMEHGHDQEPLPIPVTWELAELSEKFTAMADTIHQRSDYIRNFAMHISHEFKTPLTSILGAIELLRDHAGTMSEEEKEKFFSNITEDTDRLKKLVSRLLELARADVLKPVCESCDIVSVITHIANRYQAKGITVGVSTEMLSLQKPLSPEVLETVIINLIENSMQNKASRVTITIKQQRDNTQIILADNGAGVSVANAALLFTPFFTTHREYGGTGLGLVIVQSLLHHYHARIELTKHTPHAEFTISLI